MARRGIQPREPVDQRYADAGLFGAIYPARDKSVDLALLFIGTDRKQLHLDETARCVAQGTQAVAALNPVPRHTTAKLRLPRNISLPKFAGMPTSQETVVAISHTDLPIGK